MQDFSRYDLEFEKYQRKLPHYLQTPGSIIMNQIRLYYDIMNEYKEKITDLWSHFNLDMLLSEYFIWRETRYSFKSGEWIKDPNGTYILSGDEYILAYILSGDKYVLSSDLDIEADGGISDKYWKYSDLVEKLCKTYDIFREHPVGLLRNSHMIRLLKVRTLGVGFDGTKEKLEELLEALFPKETSTVRYIVKTVTNGIDHATAIVYLVKKADSNSSFDNIDNALFAGGYYFLTLLGITLNFIPVLETSLIYDNTTYDDGTNDEEEQNVGNKYDEGRNI